MISNRGGRQGMRRKGWRYTVVEATEIGRAVGREAKNNVRFSLYFRRFDETMSKVFASYKRSVLDAIRKRGGKMVSTTFTIPKEELRG